MNPQYATTKEECIVNMMQTFQFENISILEHGYLVHKKYLEILKILKGEAENIYNLPDSLFQWFTKNYSNLLDIETMKKYHILHDCGKPYCLTYDNEGRKHFTNHAIHSYNQYCIFSNNNIVSNLILNDMAFHTCKGDTKKSVWHIEHSCSLYLTAWAEILANCIMFGGLESTSFKIKRKHLIKLLGSIL